ncbi:MAG: 30S ribosomal protein S17 [Chlamydiae bacterium]|nr:30S ribosomal protein S17 [Chlamydiota bacterium]
MEQLTRNKRKLKEGVVVSNKMQKTVVVEVTLTERHSRYGKVIKRKTTFFAHTEDPLNVGEKVTIMETRPLSKRKSWRVVAKA